MIIKYNKCTQIKGDFFHYGGSSLSFRHKITRSIRISAFTGAWGLHGIAMHWLPGLITRGQNVTTTPDNWNAPETIRVS